MNLCSDGHDEICHAERNCPMCALIDSHKQTVSDWEDKVYDLNANIEKLDSTIDELIQAAMFSGNI